MCFHEVLKFLFTKFRPSPGSIPVHAPGYNTDLWLVDLWSVWVDYDVWFMFSMSGLWCLIYVQYEWIMMFDLCSVWVDYDVWFMFSISGLWCLIYVPYEWIMMFDLRSVWVDYDVWFMFSQSGLWCLIYVQYEWIMMFDQESLASRSIVVVFLSALIIYIPALAEHLQTGMLLKILN